MELQRTANAGVLLKLDGVKILLDGLCDRVEGYVPTPPVIADQLMMDLPDILAFTHYHPDHCSESLLLPYRKQNLRPFLGPESLYMGAVRIGEVTITPVETRHLGKTEPGLRHVSFVIQGSKCIWFAGDAAPIQWKNLTHLPRPDVLIAPFAYANTPMAWDLSRSLAKNVVILHLPEQGNDPYGLWNSVKSTTNGKNVYLPQIGEWITL